MISLLHKNPDRTLVGVLLGNGAKIGSNVKIDKAVKIGGFVAIGNDVKIGKAVKIGDFVKIGNGVKISDNVTIGSFVTTDAAVVIGNNAQIGNGAKIGDRVAISDDVAVGERAIIAPGSCLKYGRYLHFQMSRYTVDAYCNKEGKAVLRFGCETHLLRAWTPAFQRQMCKRNDPKAARDLSRAVRAAREFFKGKKQ